MKVTLAYSDFRNLIQTTCRVMESSDLGRDALQGETAQPFRLNANGSLLTLDTAFKGMEIRAQVETATCEDAGELAINPFLLKRMSVKAPEIALSSDDKQLHLKAGRFKSTIAAVQNAHQQRYDEVALTHTIPAKLLIDSLAMTAIDGQTGQPFSRLVWTDRGIRVWTHNAYNAAYAVVLDEPGQSDLDCVVPVNLLAAVAGSAPKQDLRIGADRSVLRLQNDIVDITHPIQTDIEIEDIESAVSGLDRDSIPTFEINPVALVEALQAVGSVDHGSANTPRVGVDLWLMAKKSRMIVSVQNSVGQSTHRVDLGPHTLTEDTQLKLNHKQLIDFTQRARSQKLQVGILPDRTVMWAGTTVYILAPVQDDTVD
jgi:hypothetical protein